MLPMVASQLSWLNTRRAMVSTTAKATQLDRRNLLHPELESQHHRHPLLNLRAMELLPLLHRRHPDHRGPATVQYRLHQACKCYGIYNVLSSHADCAIQSITILQCLERCSCIILVSTLEARSRSRYHGRSCGSNSTDGGSHLEECNVTL
jgi:hypothetical protein